MPLTFFFMPLLSVLPVRFVMGAMAVMTSILDNDVLTFIIEGAKQIIGLFSIQPLGAFLTISLLGSIVALVASVVAIVRSGGHGH